VGGFFGRTRYGGRSGARGQESQVLKSERLYKNRVVVKYEVEDSVLT